MTLSPKMVAFTTIATLAYLALAVVGEGGVAAFASHPALLALVAVTLVLSASALFTRGNLSSGVREDRGNRWVLAAFALIGLLLGFLPAVTDRLDVLTIDGEPTRWLGVALSAGGGVLRSRRSSCSASGSAASSRSSLAMSSSRMVFTASSAIRATSDF